MESELMIAADEASRTKDNCFHEVIVLKRQSLLQYENMEEMKQARSIDEFNKRKIQLVTEELKN